MALTQAAVLGDGMDHGAGNIGEDTCIHNVFVNGIPIATNLVPEAVFPDTLCNSNVHCAPLIVATSDHVYAGGALVHRDQDFRACMGVTVTSGWGVLVGTKEE